MVSFPRDNPPVWFLLALAGEVLLRLFWPGPAFVEWPWTLAGTAVVGGGFALVLWAALLFRRMGTGIRPGKDATALVLDGPYRFTRNPMYLGLTIVLAGVALAFGRLTPALLPPLFAAWIDRRFVRREERFMAERFGDAYRSFCQRVRRWL